MADLTARERLEVLAGEMVAEAFLADMHADPDVGVREIERLKADFIRRLNEFACDEIERHVRRFGPKA